jgi:hypothetical protein
MIAAYYQRTLMQSELYNYKARVRERERNNILVMARRAQITSDGVIRPLDLISNLAAPLS